MLLDKSLLPHLEWKFIVIELPETFLLFGCLHLRVLVNAGFGLRRPPWFVCLVHSLPSNIFCWVGTPGDRAELVLNLHSWKTIYLKIIALFLSSFWCTTFLFLSLRCNISSGGEKISDFFSFEFVLRVFFAGGFVVRIDEILLKRNFFLHATLVLKTS